MRIIGYKLNLYLIKITENGFNRVKIDLNVLNLYSISIEACSISSAAPPHLRFLLLGSCLVYRSNYSL